MIIGVDFDNTIACYDRLIEKVVLKHGFLGDTIQVPAGASPKTFIRDRLRELPDGDLLWQQVQAEIYGREMAGADIFPGAEVFFREFLARGHRIHIISHKTERSPVDPQRVNLREAARKWILARRLVAPDRIHFASTRNEKIDFILGLACDIFIDDLEEVFSEERLRKQSRLKKILFSPSIQDPTLGDLALAPGWAKVQELVTQAAAASLQSDEAAAIRSLLPRLELSALNKISAGRNSRVLEIVSQDGTRNFAKFYYRHSHDSRDRRQTEKAALDFIQSAGLRQVPKCVASGSNPELSIFESVDGVRLSADQVSPAHVDALAGFLLELHRLSKTPGANSMNEASEAVSSMKDLVLSIQRRIDRLEKISSNVPLSTEALEFLKKDLAPAFASFISRAQSLNPLPGIKTLSPSDFGFHNAILRSDGQLRFLDFEYFGWDDPAKMISDFVLHPAMRLPAELYRQFYSRIIAVLGKEDPALSNRVRAFYPLLGIKWCLILLNEFLNEDFERRSFAGSALERRADVCRAQLTKAEAMLARIRDECESKFAFE